TKSCLLCYRDTKGEHRNTLGQYPAVRLERAVREAAKLRGLVENGAEGVPAKIAAEEQRAPAAKVVTVNGVLDDWLKRHADLRSYQHHESAFRRQVRPALGKLPIHGLNKAPIRDMAEDIGDRVGRVMADKVISYLASVLNWYAARVDDFV